jgi:general nucleoside transport system ATP-binding protein
MLELAAITKSFGPVTALSGVTLTARPAEIHGLLGENGAGKSTLMNILFGLIRPDSGSISVDGEVTSIASPRSAGQLGIGMVHQHFKLVPTLTVLENFLLPLQNGLGLLHRKRMLARLRELFARLHWPVDPDARLETLSVGQQQRVEIAKALATGGKILILDEPTSVLTPQESTELFTALRTLAHDGTTIIFISHKLAEVRQICTALTILRRGQVVHTGRMDELTDAQIAEKMIGGTLALPHRADGAAANDAPPLLHINKVSLRHRSTVLLDGVSLAVSPGQIVGIAGVDGNGQDVLMQTIIGTRKADSGSIAIEGRDATGKSVRWRVERMAYVPEDRHRQALVLPLSIERNLLLKDYRKRRFSTLGFLRGRQWRTQAKELVGRFDIRCGDVADPVGSLSGGNQQKVVVARELSGKPHIVIAVNPTRGLDIGATAFVLQQLLDARNAGAAVLLIHSDLDELLSVSDRVLVMYNGTLRDSGWPEATKENIGRMMLGVV